MDEKAEINITVFDQLYDQLQIDICSNAN